MQISHSQHLLKINAPILLLVWGSVREELRTAGYGRKLCDKKAQVELKAGKHVTLVHEGVLCSLFEGKELGKRGSVIYNIGLANHQAGAEQCIAGTKKILQL